MSDAVSKIMGEAHALDPAMAYYRSRRHRRDPYLEAAMIDDPYWSCSYAMDLLNQRWPEAEEKIASSAFADMYLKRFPSARQDWLALNWLKPLAWYE